MPLPQKSITLNDAEIARLRAAIALPRPGGLLTVSGVYLTDLSGPPDNPRASFETDAFETGRGTAAIAWGGATGNKTPSGPAVTTTD